MSMRMWEENEFSDIAIADLQRRLAQSQAREAVLREALRGALDDLECWLRSYTEPDNDPPHDDDWAQLAKYRAVLAKMEGSQPLGCAEQEVTRDAS